MITVVSGLPRSGTSMMMQMLEAGGMRLLSDGVRGADESNPRGYHEFEPVKTTREDPSWLDRADGKAVKAVSMLLYDLPPGREYAVVFSDHPLAGAVRRLKGDAARVLQWLRERGTTHVFVHWEEIRRLRNSYGFYPEINAELFDHLTEAGLKEIALFTVWEGQPAYGTLYEVPRDE